MAKEEIMILELAFKGGIGAVIAYLLWRFKKVEDRSESSLNRKHARTLIDDKIEPLKIMIIQLKEDSARLQAKIDKLGDRDS